MVENLGTMPSPRSAEPVIALKLCRRCSDLLGKIRNHGIRKLAGAATKASRRTVQEQLRGKAEPRRRRLCIQKCKIFENQTPASGQILVRLRYTHHRHCRLRPTCSQHSNIRTQQSTARIVSEPFRSEEHTSELPSLMRNSY